MFIQCAKVIRVSIRCWLRQTLCVFCAEVVLFWASFSFVDPSAAELRDNLCKTIFHCFGRRPLRRTLCGTIRFRSIWHRIWPSDRRRAVCSDNTEALSSRNRKFQILRVHYDCDSDVSLLRRRSPRFRRFTFRGAQWVRRCSCRAVRPMTASEWPGASSPRAPSARSSGGASWGLWSLRIDRRRTVRPTAAHLRVRRRFRFSAAKFGDPSSAGNAAESTLLGAAGWVSWSARSRRSPTYFILIGK